MTWKNIKISADNTHFIFEGKPIFSKIFFEVLKFHSPGIAAVIDESGAYHIDISGTELYPNRYKRTFGFYNNRASVIDNSKCYHINEKGERAYLDAYLWTGNYQEEACTVRNDDNEYYHINLDGDPLYNERYSYAGDFKDGIACVKFKNGLYRHVNKKGDFINDKSFHDLGVFHKNFATAKDHNGWHHINENGFELYKKRFLMVEPFYNGFALVTQFNYDKIIIDEQGNKIIDIR